jgi:hypothetical protein
MDVSSQYGTNPFHWYLTNALPTIFLGPLGLVPLLGGMAGPAIWKNRKSPPKIFLASLIWCQFCETLFRPKTFRMNFSPKNFGPTQK